MTALWARFGALAIGTVLMIVGLLLARKHKGWSLASLIGGMWLLALWAFADQGSL